ncbi:MAG: hypothetical protein ABL949_12035 [Fimbriimonadaceae bacterium]
MSESTPAPSRKRRRWLLALLSMVLLGYGWWWSTRPSPLPEFLVPYEDRIVSKHMYRDYTHSAGFSGSTFYFVDVPFETLLLDFADQAGFERLDVGLSTVRFSASGLEHTPVPFNTDQNVHVGTVILRGRKVSVISLLGHLDISPWDQMISRICPDWLNRRFVKQGWIGEEIPMSTRDPAFTQKGVQELLRRHAAKPEDKK